MNHGRSFRDECEKETGLAPAFREIAEVLRNPAGAAILNPADRAILALARKIASCPETIVEADIDALRAAGLTEENIVDAISCAAYRVYANALNFALGEVDRDPEGPEEVREVIRELRDG